MSNKLYTFFLLSLSYISSLHAQEANPVTRYHAYESPYVDYQDNFFSGFMQRADARQAGGFLQMPYIGNPVLVYVGEKDSTQFMAYGSGYEFDVRRPETGRYEVRLERYGIKATAEDLPATLIQRFAYPDTTAAKGFLLDVDNFGAGEGNEDMNVYLVDKYTIRAYKRGAADGTPGQYYYARFSHPFVSWNVRREKVTLRDGSKEARCKAAFTFDLKKDEELIVRSSVSAVSSDLAYSRVEGHTPNRPFDDKRYFFDDEKPLLAQADKPSSRQSTGEKSPTAPTAVKRQPVRRPARQDETPATKEGVPFIEITTKEATLSAAFYAALDRLKADKKISRTDNAADFLTALTPYYKEEQPACTTPAALDSLLRSRAAEIMAGKNGQAVSLESATWFVYNALGFSPEGGETPTYRLRRPLFNIVTLNVPNGRRLIIHTKNNRANRPAILSATLMRQPLEPAGRFTQSQLLRGGVMQLQMGR